jgi:methyltransferase (TIGR00027 family)
MEVDTHSMTAVMVAAIRAHHSAQSGPKIFDDTFARLLLSDADRERYAEICVNGLQRLNPSLAASCSDRAASIYHAQRLGAGTAPVLVRARYIEEALLAALGQGIQQYVIIGAGLDTFAFRRPDLAKRLQIFEIDHPATQAFKRARLENAGLVQPEYLHFAAADLEHQTVSEALVGTPYDPQAATFFAWPGVAMYLSHDAVLGTLRCIAGIASSSSELVFDYLEPDAFAADAPPRVKSVLQRVREFGEPIVSGLDPRTLRSELSRLDLRLIEDVGPGQVQTRFLDQTDGFRSTEYWHLARSAKRGDDRLGDA